jgi:hypothetical protein
MSLTDFYSLMAVTCFTLVGLWWTVVERHPEWKAEPRRRSLAGGVYLSFLLPGLMSIFAQVDASNPVIWRISFGLAAIVGGITTVRLVSIDRNVVRGAFRRFRWLVVVLYGLILVLAVAPALAQLVGMTPLQAASIGLILLIVLAHGITWEFMMESPVASQDS